MRFFDFSSWSGIAQTVGGILLITVLGMGVRILMMLTLQQRQQRMNRQINERLRTLMAAYKVLGGSFTGMLTVDPRGPRKYREAAQMQGAAVEAPEGVTTAPIGQEIHATAVGAAGPKAGTGTQIEGEAVVSEEVLVPNVNAGGDGAAVSAVVIERRVQIRNAVEAALSDILLLGTEEHVRLAGRAAAELAAGHPIHTAELVVSLRTYIRKALGLEHIPEDILIPAQGPTRPAPAGSGGPRGAAREGGAGREGGGGGGGGMMGGGMGGGGMGMGMGMGMGRGGGSDQS